MVGLLAELAVSWLLLRFLYRENLEPLGFRITKSRLIEFLFGLLAAVISCAIYFLLVTGLTNTELSVNSEYSFGTFLNSVWWTLKSVLFEELLFRGAVLYILIRKIGALKACIVSAIAFGIYHWFSYGIFGNVIPMIYILILTGIAGLMFAIAYAETKSMYMPIGLHLGWNLVTIIIFSEGPLGNQILISANGAELEGLWSLVMFLFQIFFLPAIIFWYFKRSNYSPSVFRPDH